MLTAVLRLPIAAECRAVGRRRVGSRPTSCCRFRSRRWRRSRGWDRAGGCSPGSPEGVALVAGAGWGGVGGVGGGGGGGCLFSFVGGGRGGGGGFPKPATTTVRS